MTRKEAHWVGAKRAATPHSVERERATKLQEPLNNSALLERRALEGVCLTTSTIYPQPCISILQWTEMPGSFAGQSTFARVDAHHGTWRGSSDHNPFLGQTTEEQSRWVYGVCHLYAPRHLRGPFHLASHTRIPGLSSNPCSLRRAPSAEDVNP